MYFASLMLHRYLFPLLLFSLFIAFCYFFPPSAQHPSIQNPSLDHRVHDRRRLGWFTRSKPTAAPTQDGFLGNCEFKKRIIVDVSQSGLGNRLLSLTSAAVLAAALDSVLELKWHATETCGALYEGILLFLSKSNLSL